MSDAHPSGHRALGLGQRQPGDEAPRLGHRHLQHFGDVGVAARRLDSDFENFRAIACTVAVRTAQIDVAQELHLDVLEAVAAAAGERKGQGERRGEAENPRILLDGHLDEVGFIVQSISDEGRLAFVPLGGWWGHVLLGQRVEVLAEGTRVPGVVGAKPPHFLPSIEAPARSSPAG